MTGELPVTLDVPAGPGPAELPERRPRVALDRALRGVRLRVRHRPRRGCATPPGEYRFSGAGAAPGGGRGRALRARLGQLPGAALERDQRWRTCAWTRTAGRASAPAPARRRTLGAPSAPRSGRSTTRTATRLAARFVRVDWTGVRDPAAPNDPARVEWYCDTCSFRPWLDAGEAAARGVHVRGARTGRAGRWTRGSRAAAGRPWSRSPRASARWSEAGAVLDRFGNFNGEGAE